MSGFYNFTIGVLLGTAIYCVLAIISLEHEISALDERVFSLRMELAGVPQP